MRLDLEQNHPEFAPSTEAPPAVSDGSRSTEAANLLREGIKAAQAGDRPAARSLLMRSVEIGPDNEKAWLWLSSISEYPEELLSFLNRVLEINPENVRAIEWSAATKALLAKSLVQRGVDAAESNQAEAASELFDQAIEYDEHNTEAWLWLAALAPSGEEKLAYYERVLEFDPQNETALAGGLEVRDSITRGHLSNAAAAADAGRFEEADQVLEALLANDPGIEAAWVLRSHLTLDFGSKGDLFRKVLEINPANAFAAASLESIETIRGLIQPQSPELHAVDRSVSASEEMAEVVADINEPEAGADVSPFPSYDHTIIVKPLNGNASLTDEDAPFVSEDVDDTGSFSGEFEPTDPSYSEATHDEPESTPLPFSDDSLNGQCDDSGTEPVQVVTYEMLPEEAGEAAVTMECADSNTEPQKFPASIEPYNDAFSQEISRPSTNPFGDSPVDDPADQFKTIISMDPGSETFPPVQSFDPLPAAAPSDSGRNLDVFSVPFDSTFYSGTIPMPADAVVPPAAPAEAEAVAEAVDRDAPYVTATADCEFCGKNNEAQAVTCQGCQSVLTLADLELVLANQSADKAVLRQAVEKIERERAQRELTEVELMVLGIGHLNLRNLQYGYEFLQQAAQRNPDNFVLSAQVHALHIRLEEIKRQDENHEAMTKGKTILVVDDSPTVRKLIAGKLEKCGHEVHCTNDGVEAMERLADLRPDLVLLDINMPRMDGYQVCKLIRSNDATKDVPVVMISGKDGFFDKVRGRMAGTSGYITKPFGPETLMKTVESYLKGEV